MIRNDPDIEIRAGPITRVVPAVALAAILHVPPRTLREALFVLLDPNPFPDPEPTDPGEPTEGVRSETFDKNVSRNVSSETLGREGSPREGEPFALARRLAEQLGDERSVAGIAKLARLHPEPLLWEALRRTLEIAPEKIRKSRGACFTGIVRTLVRQRWPDTDHENHHA